MPHVTPIDDMLDEGETVEVIARRHWVAIVIPVASSITMGILASGLLYTVLRYPEKLSDAGPVPLLILAALALYCLAVVLLYAILSIQAANMLILTNKSIYFLTQHGLLGRDVKQLGYNKVENVGLKQKGILANTFDYGELTVVTAGETDNIIFHKAPHPHKISDVIMDRHEKVPE